MNDIPKLVAVQREFFRSGKTLDAAFRLAALERLYQAIVRREPTLSAALAADLGKSEFESYETEIGLVLSECRHAIRHLRAWARPRRVPTPLTHFPAKSRIVPEPYGVTLIVAPWNYPVQLALEPLVGALAAGNCAIVKPSELAPHTAGVLAALLAEAFDPGYVTAVCGGVPETTALLAERFDFIFFTGSPHVGRIVMEAAAKHLTPVTLELGGKSPCVVDETADLSLAAKRIVWGKFLNAGQTCVAPDYLLVSERVKEPLVLEMKRRLAAFFGPDPLASPDYPSIVNDRHFARLSALLSQGNVLCGGQSNPATRRIAPTLLDSVPPDAPLMQEEIFGPLLPIVTFRTPGEAADFIRAREKPLAFYLFTRDRAAARLFERSVPFGGGCINDAVMHITTPYLPFGGVGTSGMGRYHGEESFRLFSHEKSILSQWSRFDLPVRYPPYRDKTLRLLKKLLK